MMLVFGKTGQVASELARIMPDAVYLGRREADLADPAVCARLIDQIAPDAVINAAAYTAVDRAESEPDIAMQVNAAAPAAMARACARLDIPLVHISTDYVFDGAGTKAFAPDHPTAPLNVYGASKLRGEVGVCEAGGRFAILRTSWVFSAHGANFVRTMLRLGAEREMLSVVADQIGGPTPARAIAQACVTIATALREEPQKAGIYHFSGAPETSWAAFARAIMATANLPCRIEDIPTSAYPTPATRPVNSRLDCRNLSVFGLQRPDWNAELATVIAELKGAT